MPMTQITQLQTWLDKDADIGSGFLPSSISYFQSECVVANNKVVQPKEWCPYTLH